MLARIEVIEIGPASDILKDSIYEAKNDKLSKRILCGHMER